MINHSRSNAKRFEYEQRVVATKQQWITQDLESFPEGESFPDTEHLMLLNTDVAMRVFYLFGLLHRS